MINFSHGDGGMRFMVLLFAIVAWATTSMAQQKLLSEKVFSDERGFITCTGGGSSAPLFNRECQKLNLSRLSGAGIKYEGTCVDSNGTTFFIICDAFTFEYNQIITPSKSPINE
jgi:hypothetical protein